MPLIGLDIARALAHTHAIGTLISLLHPAYPPAAPPASGPAQPAATSPVPSETFSAFSSIHPSPIAGQTHRDIKSANVLLQTDPSSGILRAKLCDWGSAAPVARSLPARPRASPWPFGSQVSWTPVGTLLWMVRTDRRAEMRTERRAFCFFAPAAPCRSRALVLCESHAWHTPKLQRPSLQRSPPGLKSLPPCPFPSSSPSPPPLRPVFARLVSSSLPLRLPRCSSRTSWTPRRARAPRAPPRTCSASEQSSGSCSRGNCPGPGQGRCAPEAAAAAAGVTAAVLAARAACVCVGAFLRLSCSPEWIGKGSSEWLCV